MLMNLNELLAGFRFFPSYIRVGGLREDIPRGFKEAVKRVPRSLPGQARRVRDADHQEPDLAGSHPRRRRDHATTTATSGACSARSRAPPAATTTCAAPSRTCGYDTYEFDVIGASNGDVYDRYLTRVAEMRESVKICHQALERIAPVGAWAVQRQAHRAAAQGSGLHGDGSADSALPDLLAGLQGAGRRRLRAGRRAARRARLLRRVGRHQPSVARAHARARAVWPARRCTSSSSAA